MQTQSGSHRMKYILCKFGNLVSVLSTCSCLPWKFSKHQTPDINLPQHPLGIFTSVDCFEHLLTEVTGFIITEDSFE